MEKSTGIGNMKATDVDKNEADPLSEITIDAVNSLDNILDALELAENNQVNIDNLETLEEIQMRLKCHLIFKGEGDVKTKNHAVIEAQIFEMILYSCISKNNYNALTQYEDSKIKGLGSKDAIKRAHLSSLVKEIKDAFPQALNVPTSRRQELMEDLLQKDGTTDDIRHDCDLRIASLDEKECVILVSGESSAGKSSLLNLLLGEEILPTHMLPCTSFITVIKYDSKRFANVVYKNGDNVVIPNLDKEGLEVLQQRAYFNTKKTKTDKADIYNRKKEGHDVAEIQVFLPLPLLESGLVLVDTPGIGENEFLEHYLMDYIKDHQILGFMYIIMTDNALGVAEDRLMTLMSLIVKSQKSSANVIKFNPKAALFVCNRWDLVAADSKKSVRENVLKQLRKAWPGFDHSHAVFLSTIQAKREMNNGYITDEYIAFLHGLLMLFDVSLDKRINASYRWIGTVLQRTIHYLKTMVHQLDMSDIERQKKTQEVSKNLNVLKEKAGEVIATLEDDMERAVDEISDKVKVYLQNPKVKDRLTKSWGQKKGELPDMECASGSWEWIKRHIENAFDDRVTDLLREWDESNQIILSLEKRLFREAKLNLSTLESDLYEVENDAQQQNGKPKLARTISFTFMHNMCGSIEDFATSYDLLDEAVPKKLGHRLKKFVTKAIRKRQDQGKLEEYIKNPSKIAQQRSEKLLEYMIKNKDDRLGSFVKDFLQRPYNYIKRLEGKIPGLIDSNKSLLEQFEKDFLEQVKCRKQYIEMMASIEKVRIKQINYAEDNMSVNDFDEKDIDFMHNGASLTEAMTGLLRNKGVARRSQFSYGLWHTVYPADIRKTNEKQSVMVKIYSPEAKVENSVHEIVKLRCLLHTDVCIAELLGVFQQQHIPTPAMIFSGRLLSLREFMEITPDFDTAKLLQDILTGLQYIHSKGLVHMELNKDTVTVTDEGEVKMTGSCLPRKPVLPDMKAEISVPEFAYLAPEVLQGQVYVSCADMYAFSILSLEVSFPDSLAFGDMEQTSLETFLNEAFSARDILEPHILSLSLSRYVLESLLLCLENDITRRPDASKVAATFKERKGSRRKSSVFNRVVGLLV